MKTKATIRGLAFSVFTTTAVLAQVDPQPVEESPAGDPVDGETPDEQSSVAPEVAGEDEDSGPDGTEDASPPDAAPTAAPPKGGSEPVARQTSPTEDEAATEEAAGVDAEDELSEAELESFIASANLSESGFSPSLDISGFADFSYVQFLLPEDSPWRFIYNNKGAFQVGNLNVYLDGRLSETVRSLVEIRFTYLPHGNVTALGPPVERANNSSSDYLRNERDIRIGGIAIERAWIEWSPHQLFSVKAGQWLTPYGLWNVDHGSPTIIPAARPFMIDESLMPEAQSGLLAEGRVDVTDALAIEYAAGVSNGRGPIDMYFEYDANRALTGRLKLLYRGIGDLQIGTSGYMGKYTLAELGLTVDDGSLAATERILYQYDETTIAADVRYTLGGFLVQSEFAMNDRRFTDAGRPSGNAPGTLQPDSRRWGVYGLTGYRFDWYGIMPYLLGEFSPVPDTSIPELPQKVVLLGGGFNIRPSGPLVFKLGFTQTLFPDKRAGTFDEHTLRRIHAMVAWAF